MNKEKIGKLLLTAATLGLGAVTTWLSTKQQEKIIEEKVVKTFSEKMKES